MNFFVNTQSIAAVSEALAVIHSQLFPTAQDERGRLHFLCEEAQRFFAEGMHGFQRADTHYHDLEHTLQVVVCLARLLKGAWLQGHTAVTPEAFERALIAAFFHDVGYFKVNGDTLGTGAKYTYHHEMRATMMAGQYLAKRDWPIDRILSIQRLIMATAGNRAIRAVLFEDDNEAFLGAALCTADFIGQMSDPRYVERLPLLYAEIEEANSFEGIPNAQRAIPSLSILLEHTPCFWREILTKKLKGDCSSVYQYLEVPYGSGNNPYMKAIEANLRHLSSASPLTEGYCKDHNT